MAMPPLEEQVLALPAQQRLALIDKLLMSLNLPVQVETDKLWAIEAEQRIQALNSGEVQAIPGEQVFAQLRAKYTK